MYDSGLSLIFQVDGELKKAAGGQKESSAAAELAGGGGWVQWRFGIRKNYPCEYWRDRKELRKVEEAWERVKEACDRPCDHELKNMTSRTCRERHTGSFFS